MKAKLADRSNVVTTHYFDAVRRRLNDVPWSQRQELLAPLAERLNDLPGTSDPERVLGSPDEYARLIREAAGLPGEGTRLFPRLRGVRPRTIVVTITLVVVIALGAGATVWALHYEPLEARNGLGYSDDSQVEANVPSDAVYYPFHPGHVVIMGTLVKNTGRFTATITGAELLNGSPFEVVEMRATDDQDKAGDAQHVPKVDKVVIPAGGEIFVYAVMRVRTDMEICKGCASGADSPVLDYEVLGVHHTLPIGYQAIGVKN